ncbi:MAG TPA: hypothetical protein PLN31_09480 [Azoarcus taiwanensis]|nr:hypothetical protein [Azoarcus taiwanensis]
MMNSEVGALAARLKKEATQHKRNGDWGSALSCMKKVHEMWMADGAADVAPESWAKYPLYLQQAGRYDEAMQVFRDVLARADELATRSLIDPLPFLRKGYAKHFEHVIYDKMRVAARREKRPDDAARFQALADEAEDAFEAFKRVRDLHNERRAKKLEGGRRGPEA